MPFCWRWCVEIVDVNVYAHFYCWCPCVVLEMSTLLVFCVVVGIVCGVRFGVVDRVGGRACVSVVGSVLVLMLELAPTSE